MWGTGILLFVVGLGLESEKMERTFPSPHDYSWWSRDLYRVNRCRDNEEQREAGLTDFAYSLQQYTKLLNRLEDPNIDGADLKLQGDDESEILVEGVGKTGYDITAKSEPWRRGYFEVLLGLARAAEFLDSCVKDVKRQQAFPKNVVIGPSNPKPRPMPPGTDVAPREEDCVPASDPPEKYYMKILTTKGFTDRQRLQAALLYARWLDYKGTPDAAMEMYKWSFDIASTSLANPDAVFDPKTYVIKPTAPPPSENILLATTAVAEHKARNRELSAALPIFLSILRARRTLPLAPPPEGPIVPEGGLMGRIAGAIRYALVPPEFPPPPSDGTEPPARGPKEKCREAALMTYIGEILYASAKDNKGREEGLAWTRESVDVAEEELRGRYVDDEAKKVCRQCLETGFDNWKTMVRKLAREERLRKKEGKKEEVVKSTGWFGFGGSAQDKMQAREDGQGRWEAEEDLVAARYRRARDVLEFPQKNLTIPFIFQ
jgi:hypothetical protein